ncbi:hypothetical protein ACTGZQ_11100 [Streptococcus suis]
MKEPTLGYVILTFVCWLLGLVFFYNWWRQVTIRDKSSVKIKGIVIGHKMCQRFHTPIVEYYVDGKRYRQHLRYYMRYIDKGNVYFTYETEEELKREILKDRLTIYANGLKCDYRKNWPVGSTMAVYYNPKNPKLAYDKRYAGTIYYFRNLTLLIFVVWLLAMSIMYFFAR